MKLLLLFVVILLVIPFTGCTGKSDEQYFNELQEILFDIDGDYILYKEGNGAFSKELVERGELFFGDWVLCEYENESRDMLFCHEAAYSFHNTYGYVLCHGWALCQFNGSDKTAWIQHSWCIDENGFYIETMKPYLQYFGIILTEEEIKVFRDYYWE